MAARGLCSNSGCTARRKHSPGAGGVSGMHRDALDVGAQPASPHSSHHPLLSCLVPVHLPKGPRDRGRAGDKTHSGLKMHQKSQQAKWKSGVNWSTCTGCPHAHPMEGEVQGAAPHCRRGQGGWRGAPSRPLAPHPDCLLSALLSPNLFLTLSCWKHKRPWLFSPRYEQRGKAERGRLRSLLKHHFGGT